MHQAPRHPVFLGGTLALSCGVLVVLGAGLRYSILPPPPKSPSPALEVTFVDCDFGNAWEQPMFVQTIRAVNHTDSPLEVVDFQTSCSCTGYRVLGASIPPHGQLPVDLMIDLREDNVSLPRDFSTSVVLTVKTASGRQISSSAKVTGRVQRSPVRLPSGPATPFTVIEGVDEDAPKMIAVTTDMPPSDINVEPDGAAVQSAEFENVGSRGGCTLTFTLNPDLPMGPFNGYVKLASPRGEAGRAFYIPVSGRVVSDAYAIPSQFVWGAQPTGTLLEEYVTLTTRSGRTVTNVTVEETAGVDIEPLSDVSGVPHCFRVATTVREIGESQLNIPFAVTVAGEKGAQRIVVPLTVRGAAATPAAKTYTASKGDQ